MIFRLLRLLFRRLFRVTIDGVHDQFTHKKILITPNHVSFLDGILLALFLPIKPVFAIYSSITENGYMRWLKQFVDFVPLGRRSRWQSNIWCEWLSREGLSLSSPRGGLLLPGL